MYITNHENEYHEFLFQNKAFWRENTGYPRNAEDRLYVDLTHDNPAYLATNLWVAKYIQRLRGGRLVGLAHGWMKACPYYDIGRVRELAHSFLVDEVVDLDAAPADVAETERRFEAAVGRLSGGDLRRAVCAFDAEQDPDIGWILYDTWLREERRGTFETVEPSFLECAQSVFRMRHAVSRAMEKGRAVGAVVGHYHYSPYSFMAREAARQAAPVYFQSLLLPVSIRRFLTEADMRGGRPADFLKAYEDQVVARCSPERLESFERRIFDIQRGAREFFKAGPGGRNECDRRDILAAYGLNPELPVVCFYVPALCGAPHAFGPIPFDDFGDWLRYSLDAAVKMPGVNFLVKRHPQDAAYDSGNLVGELQSLYGTVSNVRFLTGDISSSQMAAVCDVVATVNGTPGYEMAVRGVPAIAAGPSRYSGLGFSLEPKDLGQYKTLLENAGQHKLSGDQQRRAVIFAFFELAMGRSQSLFIPPVRTAGTVEFWKEAERNVRSCFLEEDPLYRNVRHMLAENLPFLLNTDLAACPIAAVPEPSAALNTVLAGMHAVGLTAIRELEARAWNAERDCVRARAERDAATEVIGAWLAGGHPVRFGQGEPGNVFLGAGWSVPEAGGIWTNGYEAAISLPFAESEATLCMELSAYTPEHSPIRRASLWCNGRRTGEHEFNANSGVHKWQVKALAERMRLEIVLRIEDPAKPVEGGRQLGLWLTRLWFEH